MRIIDKKQDFYDYLQEPTDTLVFDRRKSFVLTKQIMKSKLRFAGRMNSKYRFLLLQCGCSYWLFLVTILDADTWNSIEDYNIELLANWKNYNKEAKLIDFKNITIRSIYGLNDYKSRDYNYDKLINAIDKMKAAIDLNNYTVESVLNTESVYKDYKQGWVEEKYDIPILKACGIANLVDPLDVFCSIEEYFSMQKTAAEATEPKGATNNDKIIMHGFNTKTSFRGK